MGSIRIVAVRREMCRHRGLGDIHHGRVDGDRWTDGTDGQDMGYVRLGERILAALEIRHAALFERHDYAAATRNRTPRIPGPPRQTRMSPYLGLRNRRRMSVAVQTPKHEHSSDMGMQLELDLAHALDHIVVRGAWTELN